MVDRIIEKIYNGEELTSEEKTFAANKLIQNSPKKRTKKIAIPPYNHDCTNLTDACGLNDSYYDEFNDTIKKITEHIKKTGGRMSLPSTIICMYEDAVNKYPIGKRILIKEFVELKKKSELGSILGNLLK